MLTRRRVLLGLLLVVLLAAAWTGWRTYQVQRDLSSAESAAERLQATLNSDDMAERRAALGDLRVSAAAARDHSGGWWFGALTHLPLVGDDVEGIRALSTSLDTVAADGIQPLADSVDQLDALTSGDGVDLDAVTALQDPLRRAASAFDRGRATVDTLDSSGFAGFLRPRFDDYVSRIATLDRGVARAAAASEVLPTLFGGDGPRSYLLVFQNNAEIRATGGLPGSWAKLDAQDGSLTIARQGAARDFRFRDQPVLPLSDGEVGTYTDLLGTYFQDTNFTPDFPRTAELMRAFWDSTYESEELDGVISLDPVALSYLLRGTGPVEVEGVALTADNAVDQLLNEPYLRLDTAAQDAFFAEAARAIFEAATGDLASPVDFIQGLSRAADEGRFFLESFDQGVTGQLSDNVRGVLSEDDRSDPHVEIGLNDATASKMSYYLRYSARVMASSCSGDTQRLSGTMALKQSISAADAAELPISVTGPGDAGIEPGSQAVAVRIYSPTGGTIDSLSIDGADKPVLSQQVDDRSVVTALIQVTGPEDVVVNWTMTTGSGQVGPGTVGMSPSVVSGTKDSSFESAC